MSTRRLSATGRCAAAPPIPRRCRDAAWRIFAATRDRLFKLDTSDLSWVDVSAGGGAYNGPGADENWSFASFGGHIYATNANDPLQRFAIETGVAFEACPGSPPQAKYVGVVESYLVLGCLTSDTAAIAWCDTFDPTTWSTGNSDIQSFPDGGPVMGICGAAKRVIQQRAERLMVHQPGTAFVFFFEKVANARGTVAPQSIIEVGDSYAYLPDDGFTFNGLPSARRRSTSISRGWSTASACSR